MNFYVAGVKFYDFYTISDELKEGDSIQLIPERCNKFDKFAVKVIAQGTMLGYVPKTMSEKVSKMIRKKETPYAEITAIDLNKEPWYALRIRIKEVEVEVDEDERDFTDRHMETYNDFYHGDPDRDKE